MTQQLLDDTIAYVRKELTGIHESLTWADGAQAETFRMRQTRLRAELDRLESLRRVIGSAPIEIAAQNTSSANLGLG